jgi:shikimate kinase
VDTLRVAGFYPEMTNGGIVLVGPPGSGKTAVGRALGDLGYWFEDREAMLVARYGSVDHFRLRKTEAVALIHEDFLAALPAEPRPWVYESTALTEGDWVRRLRREFGGFVVRLEVALDVASGRVSARNPDANLASEASAAEFLWHACAAAYKEMEFDLVTRSGDSTPAEIAATIDAAFRVSRADEAR